MRASSTATLGDVEDVNESAEIVDKTVIDITVDDEECAT